MIKSPQKRDNDYYLARLRAERPDVHADLVAGKYRNPAEALVAAGIRKRPDGLQALRSAWGKASPAERAKFQAEICGTLAAVASPVTTPSVIHRDGYLLPEVVKEFSAVMSRRRITPGQVMRECGLDPLNQSFGGALRQGSRIRNPAVLAALGKWLVANRT